MVNTVMEAHGVRTLIDLGCGDGAIVPLLSFHMYRGFDISYGALLRAYERGYMANVEFSAYYPDMLWQWDDKLSADVGSDHRLGEMALSLDVLMHLTDDEAYFFYMRDLFSAASKLVLVYAPLGLPQDDDPSHVKRRNWTNDVPHNWKLEWDLANAYPLVKPSVQNAEECSESRWYLFAREE